MGDEKTILNRKVRPEGKRKTWINVYIGKKDREPCIFTSQTIFLKLCETHEGWFHRVFLHFLRMYPIGLDGVEGKFV